MKRAWMRILRFLRVLPQVFFPPHCPFCQEVLFSEDDICPECARKYLRKAGVFCAGCHRKESEVRGRCTCGGTLCITPLAYEGAVRAALLRYKFYHKKVYARSFTAILAKTWFRWHGEVEVDGVTFVPTTEKNRRERGYDPSQVLAEGVARRLGVPCVKALTPGMKRMSQRDMTAQKRYYNAMSGFAVQPGVDLVGKRFLLCDDILTTGATMERCAELLRDAGAEVIGCSVAHGKSWNFRRKSD